MQIHSGLYTLQLLPLALRIKSRLWPLTASPGLSYTPLLLTWSPESTLAFFQPSFVVPSSSARDALAPPPPLPPVYCLSNISLLPLRVSPAHQSKTSIIPSPHHALCFFYTEFTWSNHIIMYITYC